MQLDKPVMRFDELSTACHLQCTLLVARKQEEPKVVRPVEWALSPEWAWNVWPVVLLTADWKPQLKLSKRWVVDPVKQYLLEVVVDRAKMPTLVQDRVTEKEVA